MIPDLPDGPNLLETALRSLRDDLLPHLPDQARYTGLMVANALSIALRDWRADAVRAGMAEQIRHLTGWEDATALCASIRAGDFDAPDRDAILRQSLLSITRARLSVDNPKALA